MRIKYGNQSLNEGDVLKHLALTGQARPLSFEIIKNRELDQKAREMNLQASDQQLQQFADAYRAANGLYSAQEDIGISNCQWPLLAVTKWPRFCAG